MDKRDIVEYTIFGVGAGFSTIRKFTDYLLFDFPIKEINNYLYTLVLLITIFVGLKRFIAWAIKTIKKLISKYKTPK